jgi:hypothetical protein
MNFFMLTIVGLLTSTVLLSAQPLSPDRATELTADRIKGYSEQMKFSDAEGARRYLAIRDGVTDSIRKTVDSFIAELNDAKEQDIQMRLNKLFERDRSGFPRDIGSSFVKVIDQREGRTLIVSYVVLRGSQDPLPTISAYRLVNGKYHKVASTGEDFESFGLHMVELPSLAPNETWMLARGRAFSFNGSKTRFRAIAFDGQSFRTMWSPEDMLNANFKMTAEGFSIEHRDQQRYYVLRKPPFTLHDEFRLTPDGPSQFSSYYVSE